MFQLSGSRCLYEHFETYLNALGNDGFFYRKPLTSGIRYGKQPLSVNKLESLMKEMCGKAGLKGNFTNHSGKRSCATSLYKAGLDEQSIMDRTGHRSTAVRAYKTKTNEKEEKVSMALNPPSEENTVGTRDQKLPPTKKIKFDNSLEVHDDTRQGLSVITNGPASRGNVSYNNCHFTYTVTK
ncbi:unnamed protein product [Mytilus coruscus]|uniref:Tyr recombinase domain-containing protein n=1 Tax=Mytilus coruscus TaxID=42192 RepID=A0A6J8BLX3_MYTCO|nr:unnamed protein product [Mytilus coruscus]